MNILLLTVALVWCGFLACVAAFVWSGRKAKMQNFDDPFLAATSGPVSDVHGDRRDPLDDTLRQWDEDARQRQRAAWRQNIGQNLAPKTRNSLFGFTLALLGVLVMYATGYFSGGREQRVVSGAGFGKNKLGFSLGRKHFQARAGQNVEVSYSFTKGSGRLYVAVMHNAGLFNTPSFDKPPLWSQTVQVPGAWKTRVPIPEDGSYRVYIAAWPSQGASLTYDVSWKLH